MAAEEKIEVRMSKFPEYSHYHFSGFRMGDDEHGTWIAVPQGTLFARPGHQFNTGFPQVVLIPEGLPWVAHFFGRSAEGKPPRHSVYTDMSTPPSWNLQNNLITALDLDLDVVQQNDGIVRIDDYGEFQKNRVEKNYPASLISLALETCLSIYAQMFQRVGPFAGHHRNWLGQMGATTVDG